MLCKRNENMPHDSNKLVKRPQMIRIGVLNLQNETSCLLKCQIGSQACSVSRQLSKRAKYVIYWCSAASGMSLQISNDAAFDAAVSHIADLRVAVFSKCEKA